MSRLTSRMAWDVRLQLRNGFYYAAAVVTVLMVIVAAWLPESSLPWLLPMVLFGNLITNIDGSLIQGFKKPNVHLAGHDFEFAPTYGRVEPGKFLALVNSFGVIEIARAEGSAADSLGTERGAPVVVTDSS